jgi:beta-lactamase class A
MSLFNKITFVIFFVVLLVGSLISNIFLWQELQQSSSQKLSQLKQQYPFLSSRALNPNYTGALIVNFLPLRQQIHKEVDPYSKDFAIYFEYLPTGTTIGINEDREFTAESLLKVPVVMAYFHRKEVNNITTDPTVQIQQKELNASFGDLYKKGAGYSINLGDAVKLALQKSDNTASLILADHISQSDFDFVYAGLDIPEALDKNSPIITAQEYVSILKALYFGSVLNNDDSEYILSLLTKTDFNNLIPSGVPSTILVAHKIGLVNKEIYEDCGIVYLPQKPYALCMVSKSNAKVAQQRMYNLSHMVYQYVAGLSDSD